MRPSAHNHRTLPYFGRTLTQVREMIRDAAATWYDVAPGSFDLRFEVSCPVQGAARSV